jgi:hypothetical protein
MVDKKTQEEILRGMDEAAAQAKEDFKTLWYLKTGYKRLGRFLVAYAKEQEKKAGK